MTFKESTTYIFLFGSILFFSCHTSPNSSNVSKKDQQAGIEEDNSGKNANANTIKPHMEPLSGSRYTYAITNETETELEVNGKKVNVHNKSDIGITYDVQKDSAGNYL